MTMARVIASLLLSAAFVAAASAAPQLNPGTTYQFLTPAPPAAQKIVAQAPDRQPLLSTQLAKFTRIDAPGAGKGSGQGTIADGINASGTATGWYIDNDNVYHAFLRAPDGTFTTFDVKRVSALADTVNDDGDVAGIYLDMKTLSWRGFIRTSAGRFRTFDGSEDNGGGPADLAINRGGMIAGDYMGGSGARYHAFYRLKNGTLTEFGAPGGTETLAGGINNEGTISGSYIDPSYVYHGYVRAADGTFTEFEAPGANGAGTFTTKINRQGWVEGDYSDFRGVFHAYLRDPTGNFTEFDAPDGGKGIGADGGINRHVTVAGVYTDASNVQHGYMRRKNGPIVKFDPPGSTYTETWDINDSDVIVGDYIDSSGVYHGYLRTP
jgi:hypothetical protein